MFEQPPRWCLQPDPNQTGALLLLILPLLSPPLLSLRHPLSCPGHDCISLSVVVALKPAPATRPCPHAQPRCPIPLVGKGELCSSPAARCGSWASSTRPPSFCGSGATTQNSRHGSKQSATGQCKKMSTSSIVRGKHPETGGHLLPPHRTKEHRAWCSDVPSCILTGGLALRGARAQVSIRGVGQHHCFFSTHSFARLFIGDGWSLRACHAPGTVLGGQNPRTLP